PQQRDHLPARPVDRVEGRGVLRRRQRLRLSGREPEPARYALCSGCGCTLAVSARPPAGGAGRTVQHAKARPDARPAVLVRWTVPVLVEEWGSCDGERCCYW